MIKTEHRQVRYRRKQIAARRAAGLCIDCACPTERYRCVPCSDKHRARAWYVKRVESARQARLQESKK